MSDIFQEVDEEVRRDKALEFWKKHQNLIIAAAALIVLATGGYRFYENRRIAAEQAAGADFQQALALDRDGKSADAQAALAALVKEKKDATPKKATIPLVNPTDEDAERLQTMLNNRVQDEILRKRSNIGFTPQVCRITQAVYSANSKGSYAKAETRYLYHNGELSERESNMYSSEGEARRKARGPAVAQVRVTYGATYMAMRVIVLTDKPQKSFPAAVWEEPFNLEALPIAA